MLLVMKLAPFEADSDDWMSFVTSLALVLTTLGGLVLIQDKEGIFDADAVGTGIIVLNSLMLVLEVGYIVLVECKAVSRGKAAVRHLSHKQQKSKKNKNQAQVVPTSRTEDVRTWGAGEAKGEASSD